MTTAIITLTAANMGNAATEEDFDNWTAFVAEHIDEASGLDCDVDKYPFEGCPSEDGVIADDERDEENIRYLLSKGLWDRWCNSSTVDPAAARAVAVEAEWPAPTEGGPYRIEYAGGRAPVDCETYDQALESLEQECEVVGHTGDLSEGGDHTLAWRTEEDAGLEGTGDDGARSYAQIVRAR